MEQKKKRVLMFCTSFFEYEQRIANAIRNAGYDVDLYDERPNSGFVAKACIRYNVGFYRPVTRQYYRQIIKNSQNTAYEYIFVVKGEAVNEDVIDLLREAHPQARFVLYLWDSVANIPDCEKRMKLYDRVLTFDPQDAREYGLVFRPLFFAKEYQAQPEKQERYEYDFAFIGTAHTIRPLIVKKMAASCRERGREYFAHLYLPHPMVFLYNKICNSAYRKIKKADIRFTSLSAQQIKNIYQQSNCILDVEHQKQRGLTMRTIELVGMQKKIITTNVGVTEYDFYNPSNICVIDHENPMVEESFWEKDYEPIQENILRRYALDAFVKEIFEI